MSDIIEQRLMDGFKEHVANKNAEVEEKINLIEALIDLYNFQKNEVMLSQMLKKIGYKFPTEKEYSDALLEKRALIELKNSISACTSIIDSM